MLTAAAQVEVQPPPAPPGLEKVGPLQALTLGSSNSSLSPRYMSENDLLPAGLESQLQHLKQDIVHEVTEAIREHIERKTASAVDALWQRGQKSMQHLQKQQINQTTQLQSQLNECAEAHKKLERENAILRNGLEALMKHLTLLFGPPPSVGAQSPIPHMPPASPFFPQQSSPSQIREQSLAPVDEEVEPSADEPQEAQGLEGPQPADPTESSVHSPLRSRTEVESAAVEELMATVANLSGLSSHEGQQAQTFTLTLRRADKVPLGLDVRGDETGKCLLVESVRPGGAVEAWNRQCNGESREIRFGDSIITINGADDAESMRDQCLTVHLLKMTVVRGGGLMELAMTSSISGSRRLRADADEFVPFTAPSSSSSTASATGNRS